MPLLLCSVPSASVVARRGPYGDISEEWDDAAAAADGIRPIRQIAWRSSDWIDSIQVQTGQ